MSDIRPQGGHVFTIIRSRKPSEGREALWSPCWCCGMTMDAWKAQEGQEDVLSSLCPSHPDLQLRLPWPDVA